jgi:predicted Rossmann fold nucleotide-binding protein DprA/Smf involved in DNA uptake
MSGISVATIVVEAGETSGALVQTREALNKDAGSLCDKRLWTTPI